MLAPFILILFTHNISAQLDQQKLKAAISKEAVKMGKSYIKGDHRTLVDGMYPEAVAKLGGKEQILRELSKEQAVMKSQKIKLQTTRFEEPSDILEKNGLLQSIITQVTMMKVPDGTLQSTTNLLVLSGNNGEQWYFLDVSTRGRNEIKTLVSNLHPSLNIPRWSEPVFTPDQ